MSLRILSRGKGEGKHFGKHLRAIAANGISLFEHMDQHIPDTD